MRSKEGYDTHSFTLFGSKVPERFRITLAMKLGRSRLSCSINFTVSCENRVRRQLVIAGARCSTTLLVLTTYSFVGNAHKTPVLQASSTACSAHQVRQV